MNAVDERRIGWLIAWTLCASPFAATAAPRPSEERRPNIVLILADDLGYGDLGCYGCKDIKTPHLDGLAREGVRFTQFYSNGPECTPTRTALLTGRYQQRVGGLECAIGIGGVGRYNDAIRLAAQHELGLPVQHTTIARMLHDAGYATAICGKWHLGYEDRFSPHRHGFDHAFYCLGGGMDYFHHVEDPPGYLPVLRLDGRPARRHGYFTDLVAEDAVRFVDEHTSKPFFLYVPFTAPHAPYQGPKDERPEPLPAGSPLWNQSQGPAAIYAAMVERMDQAVGRILAALDKQRLAMKTLVIFASDNGGTASARPCGLRGIKGSTFEGGIRVPCVVRWPGVLPADAQWVRPTLTLDLTASVARAGGVQPSKDRPFDGVDILRFVQRGETPPARALFWRGRRGDNTFKAVREGPLKYVVAINGARTQEYLFDLDRDAGERNNLLSQRTAEVERLRHRLADWELGVRPER